MPNKIKTTVVGSYPVPAWLAAAPSEQALTDATRVVLHTQEQAGIDLVCDGEIYRFDVNHPETNGMIDYFVSRMEGVETRYSISDIEAFRADQGMSFRAAPAGIVEGEIGEGCSRAPAGCLFEAWAEAAFEKIQGEEL